MNRVSLVFLGFLGLSLVSGCVTKSTYLKEQQRANDLNSQLAALTQEKQNLENQLSETKQTAEQLSKLKSEQDQMMQALEKEIQAGQIKISEIAGKLSINMVDKILFPSGSAKLKAEGEQVLKQVGTVLKTIKDKRISVAGHTDNERIGAALKAKWPTNWELSAARATAVVRYLQEIAGVPGEMLVASGFGEYTPVADNATAEGKQQNRRIEILLTPTRETLKNVSGTAAQP